MKSLLEGHDLVLAEAAIVERLRRSGRVELHPSLVHAALVYDAEGRVEMGRLSSPDCLATRQTHRL